MSKKEKQLNESYKKIMKAVEGLENAEAITQLESAKLDILLNDQIVVLDKETGKIYYESEEK